VGSEILRVGDRLACVLLILTGIFVFLAAVRALLGSSAA
jgi:hypothetical protein